MFSALRIGNLPPLAPVILAPMAGYTDLGFRRCVRAVTPQPFLAHSEMLDPLSILRGGGKKRRAILADAPDDHPLSWQLYGADPGAMAAAARWLVENRRARMLDINMGCPKPKIARRGAGAGLLLQPERALDIAAAVIQAVSIPVTAKLRLGWNDDQSAPAPELARALEQAGAAAVTIHGRTGCQGYAGRADRDAIGRVVRAVKHIPVIANGDIAAAADAPAMCRDTGCAGVMIGRAALRNPWIIRDCIAALAGAGPPVAVPASEKHAFLQNHFSAMAQMHGRETATLLFRRWMPHYAVMFRLARADMLTLLQTRSFDELRSVFFGLGIPLLP